MWGAALASATVNFAYEYGHSGHNAVAGGYLGLLSLFGMVMFHEFLDQFEGGTGYVKWENPKFGLRWLTWPTNTFCAAVAWRNHPPVEGTPASVRPSRTSAEFGQPSPPRERLLRPRDTSATWFVSADEASSRLRRLRRLMGPRRSRPRRLR